MATHEDTAERWDQVNHHKTHAAAAILQMMRVHAKALVDDLDDGVDANIEGAANGATDKADHITALAEALHRVMGW